MHKQGETWLEDEALAYNTYSGTCHGSGRRARVRFADGRLRIVRVGVADTYFSCPAVGKDRGRYVTGTVMFDDDTGEYRFYEYKKEGRTA